MVNSDGITSVGKLPGPSLPWNTWRSASCSRSGRGCEVAEAEFEFGVCVGVALHRLPLLVRVLEQLGVAFRDVFQ